MEGEILKMRYVVKDPEDCADILNVIAEPRTEEDAGGITLDMAGGDKFWFAWSQVPGLIAALHQAQKQMGPKP